MPKPYPSISDNLDKRAWVPYPVIGRRTFLTRASALGLAAASSGAGATLLASCGSPSRDTESTGEPEVGGQLVAAINAEPDSLDPSKAQLLAASLVYSNIFEKLVNVDERGEFIPELAESWENSDPHTWTFQLRSDVTFHSGEPFTANDVKFTLERLLDPQTAAPFGGNFSLLREVEVSSDMEVVFHTTEPFASLLSTLADVGAIMSASAQDAGDVARQPVGTGPFQLSSWAQGHQVVLERNPDYRDADLPRLDEVIFRWPGVDESRVQSLRAGELHWVETVPLQSIEPLKKADDLKHVGCENAGLPEFLLLNTSKPPFDNKALRQAVAYAIDKQQILQLAYSGTGQIGSEEVPQGSLWYDGEDPYLDGPNLELARQKMREAGLENGITVVFNAFTSNPVPVKVGEILRSQLEPIGIEVEINPLEISVWLEELFGRAYDFTLAFQEHSMDPDSYYSTILHSEGGQNVTGYSSPELDEWIDEGRRSATFEDRFSAYRNLRVVLFEDCPVIFLHYRTLDYFMQNDVDGSGCYPNLETRMKTVGFAA